MSPLDGLKVLDFTQAAAGPFCGMLLGQMGADVIKIEPFQGDHFRPFMGGAWSSSININKRSLSINLKEPEGRDVILKMATNADVFIEAFVPGTMERLGLGYADVSAVNPGIIYCSISGYGQTGPYRVRSGYDVSAQCESGLMAATGEEGRPYVRIASSLIDYGTGMYAAFGISMALRHREKTGEGQHIDVSLLDTAVSWMNYWITNYSLTGENPPRIGSGHLFAAPYQVFEAADKPLFIGVSTDRFWKKFCNIMKLNDLGSDPRFMTNSDRTKNRAHLVPLVQEEIKKYPRAWLLEKLGGEGIPCAPVLTVGELMEDRHVLERKMIIDINDPALGPVKVINVPIRLSKTPGSVRTPSPTVGQHTTEVLQEVGFSPQEIERLIKNKVVLQG
ncbi:CoA transferase [Desulfallas sp. Bu1-1]|uniref:CaiB/BaiF CoA transferase family protein n=1 Tax=Desulfallas sp. Bu1-1 TaxID=2787620 RepID=UPI00189F095C|nr:CoA transferase [Desulfallas sp. Bu1-1]MBF7084516.1 CoA transferase [Desulfallas sp. Bu1-1]